MKNFLIIFLALNTYTLFAQHDEMTYELPLYRMDLSVDEETRLILFDYQFQEVNVSKNELFRRAENWFDGRYNAVDKVLVVNNKESGELVGKPFTDLMIFEVGLGKPVKMFYTISIIVEDNKYNCAITDIRYQSYSSEYNTDPDINNAEDMIIKNLYKNNGKIRSANLQYKEKTITSIQSLVLSLQQAMSKASGTASINDY
jgi:hypothetical protein